MPDFKPPFASGSPGLRESDVASLARELLLRYRESTSMRKALASALQPRALPKDAARAARQLAMSQPLSAADLARVRSAQMRELLSIASFGIESGANVGEALELFSKRLERDIAARNRLRARTGGAQALTNLGMGVFFPLFASISAAIMGSSLDLFGGSSTSSSAFLMLACAYVPLILYLSASFAHPERAALRNAASAAPYVLSALCVMLVVPRVLLSIL